MKVWVVWEGGYDPYPVLFATEELALAYLEPKLRAWYDRIVDPTVDMPYGYGGTEWRVKEYRKLGWKGYRKEHLTVEAIDVIEALPLLSDPPPATFTEAVLNEREKGLAAGRRSAAKTLAKEVSAAQTDAQPPTEDAR